jgi:hypothetical protein
VQGPLARRKATRKRRLIQTARLICHASAGNVPAQNQRGNDMSLYRNIAAKKKRIKAGSGETMRKVGSRGAPTASAFKKAAKTAKGKKK